MTGLIKVCLDSGSWKMVAPRKFAPGVEIRESEASSNGVHYRAATDALIINWGEKEVEGKAINGHKLKSKWQIADVTKPWVG